MMHLTRTLAYGAAVAALALSTPASAWEPSKTIEIVVPAGAGGGADTMARAVQGIIQKHNLSKQSVTVVNKKGGSGGEGFLDVKNSKGNEHKLIITLSNLFTTPLATGIPFNWKDITPVTMMALDEFILWVNADSKWKTAKEYLDDIKSHPDDTYTMGGTGSKQEDQIIGVALQKAAGKKMKYVPFKGGGTVAVNLVGKHIDNSVNNPIEGVPHWRSGKLRPLCVFDSKKLDYHEPIAGGKAWDSIPTCKSAGVDVEYTMLRGFFMPAGVSKEAVAYYVDLMKKVREAPEWKKLMNDGAYNQTSMSGDKFRDWVAAAEKMHIGLMKEAGFLAKKTN